MFVLVAMAISDENHLIQLYNIHNTVLVDWLTQTVRHEHICASDVVVVVAQYCIVNVGCHHFN